MQISYRRNSYCKHLHYIIKKYHHKYLIILVGIYVLGSEQKEKAIN